jgi:hypothetical protein
MLVLNFVVYELLVKQSSFEVDKFAVVLYFYMF